MRKYHLITGMPRSGTTLFSAVLNQNPKLHSQPTSSLYFILNDVYEGLNKKGAPQILVKEETRKNIFLGLFDSFYKELEPSKEVVFDTNRAWLSTINLINFVNPDIKHICFVREIPLILNSFEKIFRKHPTHFPFFYTDASSNDLITVESRCENIFEKRLVPIIKLIQEIKNSSLEQNVLFIEYENFCADTENVLRKIYEFIDEPFYTHNFNDAESFHQELDLISNSPTLHTTRKQINNQNENLLISKEILNKYDIGKYW